MYLVMNGLYCFSRETTSNLNTENMSQHNKKTCRNNTRSNWRQLRQSRENILAGVPPTDIINLDEANLSDDPGQKKCIYRRGRKYPEKCDVTTSVKGGSYNPVF